MPILERCWTPYPVRPWTSVKYGSYYTAIYSALFHAVASGYSLLSLAYVDTVHFYSLYEHLSYRGSVILSSSTIIFSLFILLAAAFLVAGIRQARKQLFIPWLVLTSVEIFVLAGLGISFIALSYSRMYPIVAALIIWCLDAFHLYCLLCVISHYQVLRNLEVPQFVILNS